MPPVFYMKVPPPAEKSTKITSAWWEVDKWLNGSELQATTHGVL